MTTGVAATPGLGALVGALEEACAALVGVDVGGLEIAEVTAAHDALRRAADRIGVVRARLLARIEEDGRWAGSGAARTFPEWVARRGGASVGTARREAALGRALERDVSATARAVERGEISLEHARVLTEVAATSEARRAALASDRPDRNEAYLLAQARRLGVDDFRRLVRRWAAAVDTAAHEAEQRAATERQYLRLVRRRDGVDLQGFLANDSAETLATALRAVAGVPAAEDARTGEQRAAAALTDLARAVLDHGLGGGGTSLVRPHLLVHVPYETYLAVAAGADADGVPAPLPQALETTDGRLGAPAELDDGTPIPGSVLAQLACDARVTRIVFGPKGVPLDVGWAQRTYTGPQRAAVVARDRTCRYPGCSAPPFLCEVHHVLWWSRLGRTSVENGVLLCAHHHRLVHQRDVVITVDDTGFVFRHRDGRPIGRSVRREVGRIGDLPADGEGPPGREGAVGEGQDGGGGRDPGVSRDPGGVGPPGDEALARGGASGEGGSREAARVRIDQPTLELACA
jgi:hypothetical protein